MNQFYNTPVIKIVTCYSVSCSHYMYSILTIKAPNKIAADDILIFYFYLSMKIRLDFSYESSA